MDGLRSFKAQGVIVTASKVCKLGDQNRRGKSDTNAERDLSRTIVRGHVAKFEDALEKRIREPHDLH